VKIEFRPDFRIPPIFKIVWPRLKEAFKGIRFVPERDRHGQMSKMLIIILIAAVVVLVILLRIL
jgi:hypothetical protein